MATLTGEEQGMGIVSWSKESNVPFLSSVVLNEEKMKPCHCLQEQCFVFHLVLCQCFDAVSWAAGRAFGL